MSIIDMVNFGCAVMTLLVFKSANKLNFLIVNLQAMQDDILVSQKGWVMNNSDYDRSRSRGQIGTCEKKCCDMVRLFVNTGLTITGDTFDVANAITTTAIKKVIVPHICNDILKRTKHGKK